MTRPLDAAERAGVRDALFRRVDVVLTGSQGRYPLCADDTGRWTYTRRGSWTAGFWCGLLWMRARRTGDVATAAAWTGRLTERLDDDTITRAMTFWYGAGTGALLTGDPSAAAIASAGAAALSSGEFPIPVGTAFGEGSSSYSIDAVAPLIRLLGSGARRQLETHLAVPRPDGLLIAAELDRDPVGALRPAHDAFLHTRGQAWGLLALADASAVLGGTFRACALSAAGLWTARFGAGVPGDLFDSDSDSDSDPVPDSDSDPVPPVDTSAAVIAAVALLKLGVDASGLIAAVVRDHLSEGRLLHARYAVRPGERASVESIWGMFFLVQALDMLDADQVAAQL